MQSQDIKAEERLTPDLAKDKKRKTKELTGTFFIGGKQVDKLTDEQCERMAERLSETMSHYYSSHPTEYEKMKG